MTFLKQKSGYNFWVRFFVFAYILLTRTAHAFVQEYDYTTWEPAGFFSGIWHGLLAPWSLVARWLINDVVMYAIPNTGWFYDLGFLLGIIGSVPIGWAAAILSLLGHILGV